MARNKPALRFTPNLPTKKQDVTRYVTSSRDGWIIGTRYPGMNKLSVC